MKNKGRLKTVGNFLHTVRLRTRKPMTDIADEAGVSRVSLYKWEKKLRADSLDRWGRVIGAYEMTTEEKMEFLKLFLPGLFLPVNSFSKPVEISESHELFAG